MCMYGLGISPDGLNVYATDDCLYVIKNFRRDAETGFLTFQDELGGSKLNGDGLGCLKSLSFSANGVSRKVLQEDWCAVFSLWGISCNGSHVGFILRRTWPRSVCHDSDASLCTICTVIH